MADRFRRLVDGLDEWSQRRRSTRVLRTTLVGFVAHEALQYGGAMAYFSILSIANLFVLGVVLASFVVGEGTARQFAIEQVTHALPLDAHQVADLIDRAIQARGGVTIIGLVLLLWSALGVFGALSGGITRVFVGAPKRSFVRDRLVGLLLLATVGILAVASLLLGLLTDVGEQIVTEVVDVPGAGLGFAVLTFVIPIGLVFVAFLVVYRVVPNRRVDVAEVWPGALVATILWTALRIGFVYYATRVAKYDTVFGPLGTGITLLVFLYFSSLILLFGAELARANTIETEADRRPARTTVTEPAEPPTETPG